MPFGFFHEITGDRPSNELPGGRPPHIGGGPIIPPPLPGVWPPPGEITHPIVIPPLGEISNPIVIPGDPTHPIALPPGIYPPLPPVSTGKYAVLIWVIGVGWRWAVVEAGPPPKPEPK